LLTDRRRNHNCCGVTTGLAFILPRIDRRHQ
jgi:hypothetical protein